MAGYAERGTKGWAWTPDQYLDVIPHLRGLGFTFLANCYASFADIEHVRWGTPGCNRWWEQLPEEKRRAYEAVVRATQAHGLDFWFSMNPNLFADRFARADDRDDVEALWRHYGWMQGLGVRTFAVALDDIGHGIDPVGQSLLVNELLRRLRGSDPDARMVFCPTIYWGDASDPGHRAYLDVLARTLDPAVLVFWTGDAVVTPRITRAAAERYREAVGRLLVVWDNYPVNDDAPTMHLGPLTGRDSELPEVTVAYMANPMCRQHRLSLLPLATSADFASDPCAYDPTTSVGRAIGLLGATDQERAILQEIVLLYPNTLAVPGANQYHNPVRHRAALASAGERPTLLRDLESLVDRFATTFGDRYPAELATIEADVGWVRSVGDGTADRTQRGAP